MNLNAIVAPLTRAVTPPVTATLKVSTGSTGNADYSRTPTFATFDIVLDVQALTGREIEHLSALNIAGILRAAYFSGLVEGLNRPAGKGGDLITFTSGEWSGSTWLVVQPLENWDSPGPAGWVKVAIQLQTDTAAP